MWAALLDLGCVLLFTGLLLYAMQRWRNLVIDPPDDDDPPAEANAHPGDPPQAGRPAAGGGQARGRAVKGSGRSGSAPRAGMAGSPGTDESEKADPEDDPWFAVWALVIGIGLISLLRSLGSALFSD